MKIESLRLCVIPLSIVSLASAFLMGQASGARPYIALQESTPGVTQHGHGTIDGTFIAKDFRTPTTAGGTQSIAPYATATMSYDGATWRLTGASAKVTGISGNGRRVTIHFADSDLSIENTVVSFMASNAALAHTYYAGGSTVVIDSGIPLDRESRTCILVHKL